MGGRGSEGSRWERGWGGSICYRGRQEEIQRARRVHGNMQLPGVGKWWALSSTKFIHENFVYELQKYPLTISHDDLGK